MDYGSNVNILQSPKLLITVFLPNFSHYRYRTVPNRTAASVVKNTNNFKTDVLYPPLHATLYWKIHSYI